MRRRVVLVLVVAGALTAGLLFVLRQQRPSEEILRQESHTVVQAVRRVLRVSMVEMVVANYQLRTDSKELFGFLPIRCRKTVAVFYRGKVQAGFDLGADAAGAMLSADPQRKVVTMRLAPPIIVATDLRPPDIIETDGSVCNELSADDYRQLHDLARTAVQREAIAAGVLAKADLHARELLPELARSFGWQMEILPAAGAISVADERR